MAETKENTVVPTLLKSAFDDPEYVAPVIPKLPVLADRKLGLKAAETNPAFNPVDVGLKANFELTKYNRLKGCGCKVPQDELLALLRGIGDPTIGMDVCITPSKRYKDMFLVATTDFFHPLTDDPYLMGQIACANVLSDMYAQGVINVDNVLMILGISHKMPADERFIATHLIMKGFADAVHFAGGKVTGGQTVINPWPVLGGCAKSIAREEDFIRPDQGRAGDALILTKPLGTQAAVFMRTWEKDPNGKWKRAEPYLTHEKLDRAFRVATASMARLNLNGAKLMHKYGAHSATDITGFGLLGDSNKLARECNDDVELVFDTLPIIKDMAALDKPFPFLKIFKGYAPETSGPLLVMIPPEKADAFCKELEELDGWPAWRVGTAVKRTSGDVNIARIVENPKVIEV